MRPSMPALKPIATLPTARALERLVVRHRFHGLPMLGWVFQDLVARHDAPFYFIEHDLSAKLDQCAAFVAGNGAGVRLKEAEHFLLRGHLLALQHAPARLGDHPLHQRQHLCGLAQKTLGLLSCLPSQSRHHLLTLPHHVLGRFKQFLREFLLLRLFVLGFAPQLPVERLGHLSGRA